MTLPLSRTDKEDQLSDQNGREPLSDEVVDRAARQFWDRWQPDYFPSWDEASEEREEQAMELRMITRAVLESVWPEPMFTQKELVVVSQGLRALLSIGWTIADIDAWRSAEEKLEAMRDA